MTNLATLNLTPETQVLLTQAGITSVEQLGETPLQRIKAIPGLLDGGKLPEVYAAYATWFAGSLLPQSPTLEWLPRNQ